MTDEPSRESLRSGEKAWVRSLILRFTEAVALHGLPEVRVGVSSAQKLAYTCEVHEYKGDASHAPRMDRYETDLLFFDTLSDDRWIPRVVVEFKLGDINTHDALTYSAKAATHKHVHPYLRYGILIGRYGSRAIPARLVKHGTYFDFMATWRASEPDPNEWENFGGLIAAEITASRAMQQLLENNRGLGRKQYRILHRPLVLK